MGAPLNQVAPLIIPSLPLFVMSFKEFSEPSLKLYRATNPSSIPLKALLEISYISSSLKALFQKPNSSNCP